MGLSAYHATPDRRAFGRMVCLWVSLQMAHDAAVAAGEDALADRISGHQAEVDTQVEQHMLANGWMGKFDAVQEITRTGDDHLDSIWVVLEDRRVCITLDAEGQAIALMEQKL